jgi:hypothetical protein
MKTLSTLTALFLCFSLKSQVEINGARQIKKDRSEILSICALAPLSTILFMNKNKAIPLVATTVMLSASIYYCDNKRGIARNTMFAIAGALDAFNRELMYHNEKVLSKLPFLDNKFFGQNSWQNKYNSKIPFAKSIMVFTTDGDHMTRFLNKTLVLSAMVTLDFKDCNFKKHVKQILVGSFYYTMAKGATHTIINY